MGEWKLLIWLTQLGLSVVVPPVLLLILTLWLRDEHGWDNWVVWVGIAFGIILGIDGLRTSLKAMTRLSDPKKQDTNPPVSYDDHT